jgi:hypothetical protein
MYNYALLIASTYNVTTQIKHLLFYIDKDEWTVKFTWTGDMTHQKTTFPSLLYIYAYQ